MEPGVSGAVARDAAGKGKLPKQRLQPRLVLADFGIDFRIGAFQISIGHHARPAVAGAADIEDIGVARLDDAVEMGIDEIETRRRAPVPEKARLHMLRLQRLVQQRIVHQIDLADRKIVGRPPVAVDQREVFGIRIVRHVFSPCRLFCGFNAHADRVTPKNATLIAMAQGLPRRIFRQTRSGRPVSTGSHSRWLRAMKLDLRQRRVRLPCIG